MFNKAVFKQAVKSNYIIYVAVLAILNLLLVQFSAIKDLTELLGVIYYGIMVIMIPSIFILIVTNKLLCAQVDSGSLAYTLSTKVKRTSIIFTQVVFLIGSIFVMFLSTTLVNIATNMIVESYSVKEILFMNMSAFCAISALAGICYMFSCIFNLSKKTMGVNGTLTIVFVLALMLCQFADVGVDALANFKYITIFGLFDVVSILDGTNAWIIEAVILVVIAIVTFGIGTTAFKKKDLPL